MSDRRQTKILTLLFCAVYMVSYITRINYGAIVSEIENSTNISKSMLSMAPTGSFITYGAGQIISGICGDRFSPKKLITCGLAATVLMNVLMPLCRNPYQMAAVWCVNGFAQAFLWPPMVRMMAVMLSEDGYKRASVKVSQSSTVGMIIIYLVSPLIISLAGWRSVFVFSAACGAVMIVIWSMFARDVDPVVKIPPISGGGAEPDKDKGVKGSGFGVFFTPIMISIMFSIILMGMMRDGVTTWMPTYIAETYDLSSIVSILTGVVLPVFAVICYQAASAVYRKTPDNPLMCAALFFAAGTVAALILFVTTGRSAALSVIFAALLTGCMHGVNLMLIAMVPPFFKSSGNVSTVSGVLNSCTYIGSALFTYGISILSVHIGWRLTLVSWIAICAAGSVLCLVCVKLWKKMRVKSGEIG